MDGGRHGLHESVPPLPPPVNACTVDCPFNCCLEIEGAPFDVEAWLLDAARELVPVCSLYTDDICIWVLCLFVRVFVHAFVCVWCSIGDRAASVLCV